MRSICTASKDHNREIIDLKVLGKKADRQQNIFSEPELHNLKMLFYIYAFLIITDYLMPQYFGLDIGYDITCTRLANIVIIFYMLLNPKIFTHFCKTIFECVLTVPLVMYLFVAAYTMVFRADINAFFLVFLEVLTLYMLIYGIRYVVGYKRAVKWTIFCAYFLSIYGLIEYVCGFSLFLKFLRTVPTAVINTYRSGHYRIMGPCGHPLAYGLLLLLFIAIACIDIERDEIYLFKRPVLIVLLMINVLLTGSRSTLGIAGMEMVIILLCSKRANIKKSLLICLGMLALLGAFLLVAYKTSIGRYILMQITSVIDQVFDTELAANFGADMATLNNSESYRQYLPKIFTLDWLNPLLGRGVKRGFGAEFDGVYIHSIDNYYVQQYVKYAYPGLISYILFMLVTAGTMIYSIRKYKSGICRLLFIAVVCYFFNLWWLDALQTLKFVYIFIAIFYAFILAKKQESRRTADSVERGISDVEG